MNRALFLSLSLSLVLFAGCGGTPSSAPPDLGIAGCVSDKSCSGANSRCDKQSGKCVGCIGDDQCSDGKLCKAGQCANGCSAGHGCGDGGVCDVDAGICRSCSIDADCSGDAPRCDLTTMQCVACLTTADNCAAGKACEKTGGVWSCVAGCKTDVDCKGDGGGEKIACCAHVCVDLSSDSANCNTCGMACGPGKSCCAAACSDPMTDALNCGRCGTACVAPNGTPACSGGMCTVGGCSVGFLDCDKNPANGCEIDSTSSVANCGACGVACEVIANGMAVCAMSKCGLTCNGSFKDCDANPANGCEVDSGSDARNCGMCGNACPPAQNGVASCAQGVCAIGSCNAPFADCNKDPKDGCEVNLSSDAMNCNACGTVCAAVANGAPGCAMGACGVGACNAPFKDCNGKAIDGCEADTSSSLANCGDCNKACAGIANGAVACVGGACAVGSCGAGFSDCDKNPANGCEVNIQSDAKNCGACGSACQNGQVCCGGNCVAPPTVNDGSQQANADLFYQYAPVVGGQGFVLANWTAVMGAQSYQVAVGTTPGGKDVAPFAGVGNVTNAKIGNLTLQGAWTGNVTYYVSVIATCAGNLDVPAGSSNGVRIAELASWDGTVGGLRAPDGAGGYSASWPENGVDAIYGAHYFESVNIGANTTVMVQGWGKASSVTENIDPADPAVTAPKDGWLEVQANTITVAGTLTASGRGYGGGGGGGATCSSPAPRGHGGLGGLGGNGGNGDSNACAGGGSGGGGSPEGLGNTGNCVVGGNGNLFGGGGGGSGQGGCNSMWAGGSGGQAAAGGNAAGLVSDIGTSAASKLTNTPAVGGAGEFSAGGGGGGSLCNVSGGCSSGGGGGGGYGAGGGGGDESWAAGGGGGGSGGHGGGNGDSGLTGAGPFSGPGSATGNPAPPASPGGYAAGISNGDVTTDRTLLLGSGGGGGAGSESQAAGGGGGAGGGYIKLIAKDTLTVANGAHVLANGAGGGGGSEDDNDGTRIGGQGGSGGGGGLLFEARTLSLQTQGNNISCRGGGGSTTWGGTIKLFYNTLQGVMPVAAGRVYDAGPNSFKP